MPEPESNGPLDSLSSMARAIALVGVPSLIALYGTFVIGPRLSAVEAELLKVNTLNTMLLGALQGGCMERTRMMLPGDTRDLAVQDCMTLAPFKGQTP